MFVPKRFAMAALAPVLLAAPAIARAEGADAAPAACTGTPSDTWITVIADGMRNGNGNLAITVYVDDSKRFLVKHGSIYVGRVKAQSGTTRGCVFLPKTGVYALALYHDENGNGKFDRSGLGLPQEGWGFTNNPPTLFGLPTFSSVRLAVPKPGLVTRIHMKYP